MGRRPIHKTGPMTPTERQRRWRARKRIKDKAAKRRTPKRDGSDFWPTPPELQVALVRYVLPQLPPDAVIWECAAGDGALVDALTQAGRVVVASDIDPQRAGILRRDFLTEAPPPGTRGAIAATNPPFNQLDPFVERALALLDAGHLKAVVLLFRADKANTQERTAVLNRACHELCITARTRWVAKSVDDETPRWWFSWIAWVAGREGPPTIRRVDRSDVSNQ